MPRLILPTTAVRDSFLQGETETAIDEGLPTGWLEEVAADFAGFVAPRRAVRELWGVPLTELWFVEGTDYFGTVNPPPAHPGLGARWWPYRVPRRARLSPPWPRHPNARPGQAGVPGARPQRDPGHLPRGNLGSRRVIEANGGTLDRVIDGEALYWLATSQQGA
jgi:hypothetical protein